MPFFYMRDHLGRPRVLGIAGLSYKGEALLTSDELEILEDQIQKNKERVSEYVNSIDRLVNIEHFPSGHGRVRDLRERMLLLMEENNTFRRTLWHHWLLAESPNLTY